MTSLFISSPILPNNIHNHSFIPTFRTYRLTTPSAPILTYRSIQASTSKPSSNQSVSSPSSKQYKPIPVHKTIPVLGFFIDNFITKQTYVKLAEKYGPLYQSDFLGLSIYNVNDLQTLTEIYKDTKTFSSASAYPPTFRKIFGEKAMFILDGENHFKKRSSVSAAFSSQLFPSYFEAIFATATSIWKQVSNDLKTNDSLKLEPYIKDHYLRLIVRITTGSDSIAVGSSTITFDTVRDLFFDITGGMFSPAFGPIWNKALRSRKTIIDAYIELIKDRLVRSADRIETVRSCGDDFASLVREKLKGGALDILTVAVALSPLKTGPGQTHDPEILEELAELVLLLWFAGFNTETAATLSAVMTMGLDRDIWNRLAEEQNSLRGTEMTIKQILRGMPLLESYMTEILRVYPPAVNAFRKTTKDTELLGHFIPKDSTLLLDLWASQAKDKDYPNAQTVQMDRFLEGFSKEKPKPPSIVTFGAVGGVHFCIGSAIAKMVVKTTLAVLVRDYDMTLKQGQSTEFASMPEFKPKSCVLLAGLEPRSVDTKKKVREEDVITS